MMTDLYYHLLGVKKPNQNISFHITDLEAFTDLTAGQQKLLIAMIRRLNPTVMDMRSIVEEGSYADFGYTKRQSYHRDKKALEDSGWIITRGKQYVICLHKVKCTSQSFYNDLMVYLGLKSGIQMGVKFKPDPKVIPKPPK